MQDKFATSIGIGEFDYDWQAYENAYSCKNMSRNAIYVESCRLRQNPKVALRISQIRAEIGKKAQITLEELLMELARWVRFDPIDVTGEDGCVLPLKDMKPEVRRNIAETWINEVWDFKDIDGRKVKTQVGQLVRFKYHDKVKLADMHMKKFGAYVTKIAIDNDSLEHIADLLAEIDKE